MASSPKNKGPTDDDAFFFVERAASSKADAHVLKHEDGGWAVRREGRQRLSAHSSTKQEAVRRARELVRNAGGGEVVVHDSHGRITDRDTITPGRDPLHAEKRRAV